MAENSLIYQLNHNIHCLQTLIDYQKSEPLFYFKVKLIINRNNSFTLADKVLGIGRSHLYLFWTEQQISGKFQALTNAKKEGVDFAMIENPQQKIALSKFDQFTLISKTDPQFIAYLKSLVPSFSVEQYPNIAKSSSILFIKSLQDYQTHCVICSSYSQGMQLLYSLQMIKSLRDYEKSIQTNSQGNRNSILLHKTNLKLMLMICNLKFGFLNASPDYFAYNFQGNYSDEDQRRQIKIYHQSSQQILKNTHSHQFTSAFNVRLYFKIIDQASKQYASAFLFPLKSKTQRLSFKASQLIEEMFESLINHIQQQTVKENKFLVNGSVFPNLKYLNLAENRLTDNIFVVFQRMIYPDLQKVKKTSKASLGTNASKNSQPLFSSLIVLDLSRNYISLQSLEIQKTLVRVLQNLSEFVLKISLRQNKIKSLQFFDKYFIKTDSKMGLINPNVPVEYFDLKDNLSITQTKKQVFINSYMQRMEELDEKSIVDIGFILNLGTLLNTGNPNIFRYLSKLQKYLIQQEVQTEFQQRNDFPNHFKYLIEQVQPQELKDHNLNLNSITFALSRSLNQVPHSQALKQSPVNKQISQESLLPTQPILQRSSTQSRQELLTQLAKLFYLRDYKQIELYKQQVKQHHDATDETLLTTFAKQYEEKRIQEKRILQLFDQVMNFFDFKGNGVKNVVEERLINDKLERLVGIVKRKGLQGQAPYTLVYLKYLRDQIVQKYMESQNGFGHINPIYDVLKSIKSDYKKIYQQAIELQLNLTDLDYKEMSSASGEFLEKRFFQNKGSPQMDEATYDRLRFILVERKLRQGELVNSAETLLKELKLSSVRAIRLYEKAFNPNFDITKKVQRKPLIHAKQKLTSSTYTKSEIKSKMEYIRDYSITHYPFNPRILASTELSGYEHPLTCLSFPETLLEQALSFITIVNNFITFLYYTPDTVSEQTVTYINYIVSYLNDLQLESFEDLEWKEFLIEEMYVHLMTFRPQQKFSKGILLCVMQYLTARVFCRPQLENYILAFLLENQPSPLEGSHLILNSLTKTQGTTPSAMLIQRQIKISWIIPNQLLLNSLMNQGKLTVHLKLDTSSVIGGNSLDDQIEIYCHQTMTVGELVSYLMDENNGVVVRLMLERKLKGVLDSSETDELEKYWLFEKITKSGKLQHFRPYESNKYIGQIISESFPDQPKAYLHLRRCVTSHHYHNKNYLSYQLDQAELYALFNKLVINLQLNIDLLAKLPQEIIWLTYYALPFSGSGSYTSQQFVNIVFAHVVCIYYTCEVNKLADPKSPTSQLPQDDLDQLKEQILHTILDNILMAKPNSNNQSFIVNCKTFSIEDKLEITNKVKQIYKHQQQSRKTLSDQILSFVHCLGDLAFYETLIHDEQILSINSRYLIVGKLLQHTNELNQIINIYSKLQYFIPIAQMTDLRLLISEPNVDSVSLCIQTIHLDDMDKKISTVSHQITADPYFVLCTYNLIIAVCKNIINFDIKLLYQIQQSGLGTGTKKRNSKKIQFYNQDHKKINGLYQLPQNLLSFDIIRNKENQNNQKLSQNNSKKTLKKEQSQPVINDQVEKDQKENPNLQEVNQEINMKQVVQEINQVYSRKSSKRSLKSNPSDRSVRRSSSRHEAGQNNARNEDSQSLIPSRKSIYDHQVASPKQGDQSVFEKPITSTMNQQIDAHEIIKKMNEEQKSDQGISNSSQFMKGSVTGSEEVVTNQQRKSRREIPKRRSSRETNR